MGRGGTEMANRSIRDKVAIVGMGLYTLRRPLRPVRRRSARPGILRSTRRRRVEDRRYRRLLLRHGGVGCEWTLVVEAPQNRLQAGEQDRKHVRHGDGCPAPGCLRGRGRSVRRGDGNRNGEAQGLPVCRHAQRSGRKRWHPELAVVTGGLLLHRARVRRQIRYRHRESEGRHLPYRLEKPSQRGAQPPGHVPS